jgi:hypothetical protein
MRQCDDRYISLTATAITEYGFHYRGLLLPLGPLALQV